MPFLSARWNRAPILQTLSRSGRSSAIFLMVKDMDQDVASTKIDVVLNWTEELKQLTARKQ